MSHANDDSISTNASQDVQATSGIDLPASNSLLSRRRVIQGAAVASTGAILFGWAAPISEPVLAISGEDEWVANGAEITSHDGSVDSITFGDPDEESSPGAEDNRLVINWSGFDTGEHDIQFDVFLRGSESDEEGWDAGKDSYESIIDGDGTVQVNGSSGDETYSWSDVFGEYQPADVELHSAIELSDFEANDDGEARERVVDVKIEADAVDQGVTAEAEAEATITVTNQGAEISVGGQGTFEITSDSEV